MTDDVHLKWCKERISELEEENLQLRRSASHFGALAERLSTELQLERRRAGDRRQEPRETPDRRVLVRDDNN